MQPWFFFNDTATTEIYTLSLHDALPILSRSDEIPELVTLPPGSYTVEARSGNSGYVRVPVQIKPGRSEEHTSELQSQFHLVCRLLLEKKKSTAFHGFG